MELAVCNADKGTISADEVQRRMLQFTRDRGHDLVGQVLGTCHPNCPS